MIRLHSVFTALTVVIISASAVRAQNAWLPANNGFVMPATSLLINGAGDLFAANPDNGVYRSQNNGQSWTLLPNPSGLTLGPVWCINGLGEIFVGAGFKEYRSSNNGDNWSVVRTTPLSAYDPPIVSWGSTKSGMMLIATGSTNPFLSIDDGRTWNEQGIFGDQYTTYVTYSPSGKLFAASRSHLDTAISIDAKYWTAVAGIPSSGFGDNISLAFNFSGEGVAAGSNGVFYSSDKGNTWSLIDQPTPNSNVVVVLAANGLIFQGASSKFGGASGLKLSIDHGATWNPLTSGLTSTQVYAIQISWAGNVYAATDSGVFRYMDPTGDVKPVASAVPSNFSLTQNYPNPATANTTIRFALPESAPVSLRVYDMAGRELALLANGNYSAGTYSVSFDTHGLTSGVYYYQIQAGAFSEARTFVVAP